MNSFLQLNKARLALRITQPRFYTALSQLCHKKIGNSKYFWKVEAIANSKRSFKCLSYCNLMKTESDSHPSSSDSEKYQKALDDKELQNILQDFAKDFGVDDESNKLLEDIRKNIDESPMAKNSAASSQIVRYDSSEKLNERSPLKFKDFSDSDASIIYSVEEEPDEETETTYHIDQEIAPKMSYINLKRGITGVFDLDQLIDVLRNENLMDITAISIPKELHYADYLVLVTAKSMRHSSAVTELILKLHKQKRSKKDPFIKVEGNRDSNWKAIDMGNIVLHIFLEETRALYDIESLWLLDSEFDSGGKMEVDPMMKIIEEQIEFFNSLHQSNDNKKDS